MGAIVACGATVACSAVEASKLPSGGYRISCEKGMEDCVGRAEKICGGKGYTVLGGHNATKRLGGSSSNYQTVVFVGQLEVACGDVDVKAPVCQAGDEQTVHALPAPPTANQPTGRACVPGSSQACVGPGGCQGGQACRADGAAFEPCDCGPDRPAAAVSTPSAPAPAPTEPAPAPKPGSGENPGVRPSSGSGSSPARPKVPGSMPEAEPLNAPR